MRTRREVTRVLALVAAGANDCEISRQTLIPRATIRDWRHGRLPGSRRADPLPACSICDPGSTLLPGSAYAYLLGIYLGDGHISLMSKGVYRLRVFLDLKYPGIIAECEAAIGAVLPANRVSTHEVHDPRYPNGGLAVVSSYSKHWTCLIPQHGPGPKHRREIALKDWQREIVRAHSGELLRGLIHSDGCRGTNRVRVRGKIYEYPRYQFSNASDDIKRIFADACDRVGIAWRQMNRMTLSVARREAVALMDRHVGPKS